MMLRITPVVITALAACVSAQETAQPPAPAREPALLSGPRVEAKESRATLIKRDFNGKLTRLDDRPEHAALALLNLTAEERKPADAVLDARSVKVAKVLSDHIDLFTKIQNARQGGGKAEEMRPLLREMHDAAGDLLDPPLRTKVAEALPEAKRAEFARIVEEYITALASEEAPGGKPAADDQPMTDTPRRRAGAATGPGAAARIELNLLLRELGRELNSVVTTRREQTEAFLRAIDATPEQADKIQKIFREQGAQAGLHPTREQRAETMRKVFEVLTPEQRRKAEAFHRQ